MFGSSFSSYFRRTDVVDSLKDEFCLNSNCHTTKYCSELSKYYLERIFLTCRVVLQRCNCTTTLMLRFSVVCCHFVSPNKLRTCGRIHNCRWYLMVKGERPVM
jgi:hypothetical protein